MRGGEGATTEAYVLVRRREERPSQRRRWAFFSGLREPDAEDRPGRSKRSRCEAARERRPRRTCWYAAGRSDRANDADGPFSAACASRTLKTGQAAQKGPDARRRGSDDRGVRAGTPQGGATEPTTQMGLFQRPARAGR